MLSFAQIELEHPVDTKISTGRSTQILLKCYWNSTGTSQKCKCLTGKWGKINNQHKLEIFSFESLKDTRFLKKHDNEMIDTTVKFT